MRLKVRRDDGVRELLAFPALNVGFEEGKPARFVLPQGGGWSLLIDDAPVSAEGEDWVWRPELFAGPVLAELRGPSGASRWLLDVSPHPEKLGRDQFEAMFEEILEAEPMLVLGQGTAHVATAGGELSVEDELQTLLSLSRLRAWGQELVKSVRAIEERPRQTLRRTREFVAVRSARRIDVHAVRRLAQSSQVRPAEADSRLPLSFLPHAQVDVPVAETSLDSAANRTVVERMERVLGLAVRTRRELEHQAERGEFEKRPERQARLPSRRAFLEELSQQLEARLRGWPWREVSRRGSTAAGMTALSADPTYARFGRLAWSILRRGMDVGAGEERMWMSPSWEIFERWCFVRLARQLPEVWPGLKWTRTSHSKNAPMWLGKGRGVTVRLILQPTFDAWDGSKDDEFRSVSGQRIPDLVLTRETATSRKWVVLDAKYRVRRPYVLEGMGSAHIYRDSLRWHGVAPEVALLLVPSEPEAGWLTQSAFQAEHRVGALVFRGRLEQLVKTLRI